MEYAIALGGGGARGSYQIGVYKALREMNIKITTVLGTSVGAINAAVIALEKYEEALMLWQQLDYSKIISFDGPIYRGKEGINLKNFIKDFAYNKGVDITPLKEMLNKYINEDKLRKTKIDFGIVTASISELKPYVLFKKDIPKGQIVDYIIASAALPIFKKHEVDGKTFIDGAIYDNVPVKELLEKGCKNIIAIDIFGVGVHKRFNSSDANVVYIKNSDKLGGVLEIDKENIERNIEMGYLDAKKAFGKVYGNKYYLIPDKNPLLNPITQIELDLLFNSIKVGKEKNIKNQILRTIRKHIDKKIDKKNTLIATMEIAAEVFEIERLKEYTYSELLNKILEKYYSIRNSEYHPIKKLSKNIWKKRKIRFNNKSIKALFTPYMIKKKDLPSMFMLITLPKFYIVNLFLYIILWRKNSDK